MSPPVPSTCADTIRGDAPRRSTSIPRREPLTRPLRRAVAEAKLMLTLQLEAALSYGSATACSHGCGAEPGHAFSMSSVIPPELAKKNVIAGWPAYRTIWPAVSATAALEVAVSAAAPSYTCERVSAYTSNLEPPAWSVRA